MVDATMDLESSSDPSAGNANHMQRNVHLRTIGASLLTAAALQACAPSVTLTDSWTSPAAAPIEFKQVLVVAITQHEQLRRDAEDALAGWIRRGVAVPSYAFMTVDELRVPGRLRSKVSDARFDGAVTMRLVAPAERREWSPGHYPDPYYDFWAYVDWTRLTNDRRHRQPSEKVRFEMNVYDVGREAYGRAREDLAGEVHGPRRQVARVAKNCAGRVSFLTAAVSAPTVPRV